MHGPLSDSALCTARLTELTALIKISRPSYPSVFSPSAS